MLLPVLCLTSCSDWFDVSPKTNIKAEELYETPEGFESALAGIYILLTDDDCYGHDMSFGLIDQLAQLYDRIPDGTTDREAIYQYTQARLTPCVLSYISTCCVHGVRWIIRLVSRI